MKKGICLLLTMCLTLALAGAQAGSVISNLWVTASPTPGAEATPTPAPAAAPGTFSFRGGIHWNMTRELVKALESVELVGRDNGSWSILYPTQKVDVSRYTADLVYMFQDDRLKMISYNFGNTGTGADFQYLSGALDAVYGEHVTPDASMIFGFWDRIYPGFYSLESLRDCRGWTAGEDTMICLYYYGENAYEILYVCAGESGGSSAYVTTGL